MVFISSIHLITTPYRNARTERIKGTRYNNTSYDNNRVPKELLITLLFPNWRVTLQLVIEGISLGVSQSLRTENLVKGPDHNQRDSMQKYET